MSEHKLILVYYIDVGNLSPDNVPSFIQELSTRTREESYTQYFIPIRGENSRIECINPKLITDSEYQKVSKTLAKMKKKLDSFLETIKQN